jgi:hypothetical protein
MTLSFQVPSDPESTNAYLNAFMRSFRDREVEFVDATPYVELSERHIANVKVVTDRVALLGLMLTNS